MDDDDFEVDFLIDRNNHVSFKNIITNFGIFKFKNNKKILVYAYST